MESRQHNAAGRFNWVLHVYAVLALAIAAPMYGRLEHRRPFLALLETITVFTLVAVWSVAVPCLVVSIIAGLRRWSPRFGAIALMSVIGGTCSLILLGALSHTVYGGGLGWLTFLGTIAAGYFIAQGYPRWSWLRSVLTVAAFGSLMFPMSLIGVYLQVSARPVVNQKLTVHNPVPVVMVVFDCFCGVSVMDQNRQIDAHRFPHFAELAATSNWYRNCTSVHPRTRRALPAILSGNLPPGDRDATVEQYPQNLFTLLNASDNCELTSFEPFTSLCPADKLRDRVKPNPWTQWIMVTHVLGAVLLHDLVPADVNIDTPRVPRIWFGLEHALGADRQQRQGVIRYSWDVGRENQFRHFLDCIRSTDQPNFWFGHFALPHFPWVYLPTGHLYRLDHEFQQVWGTEGQLSEEWADDELVVLQAHQQYLLQLGYTDKLLGELMDRLRQTGQFDRCLLIVMADHGVSFRPAMHGRLPTAKNLADIMSVPLFIKLPGQESGDVVDLNVEITDVLPSILDVLKLEPPISVRGQSVLAADFAERPKKVFTDDEHVFEVDGAFESRYDVLVELLAKFGTGADPMRIFKIGPHSELLGRRLDEVNLSGNSSIQIRPVNFSAGVDYDSSRPVPTQLEAKIEPEASAARTVRFAIAVNDTIWGTTQTYSVSYLQNFWRVMLPESAFRNGNNEIRIFQIEDSSDGITLAECSVGPVTKGPTLAPRF